MKLKPDLRTPSVLDQVANSLDAYFSADVETDGPIPGPYSMLSFALVYAGTFDGRHFQRPKDYRCSFYRELRPISNDFQPEALRVNGLDREKLCRQGTSPEIAMNEACEWVKRVAGSGQPILVAYPLSFDWSFLRNSGSGGMANLPPRNDIKTAFAIKASI